MSDIVGDIPNSEEDNMRSSGSSRRAGLCSLLIVVCFCILWLFRLDWRLLLFRPTFVAPYSLETIPIFIQDEHQNALPRWYEVIESSYHHSGYHLIHIDAHSDGATQADNMEREFAVGVTVLDPALPINDYTTMEAFSMQGQVVTGERTIESFTAKELNGIACGCYFDRKRDDDADVAQKDSNDCFNIISTLTRAQCVLERSIPMQYATDTSAASKGVLLPEPRADGRADIILDIDLDFFGVTDPIPVLAQSGWTNATLGSIDRVVELFCAPNEREEHWLATRIHEIVALKRPSTRGFDMERYVCSDAEQSFDELVASLQATIRSILSQTGAARGKALMATLHKVGFSAQVRSFRGPEPEFPAPMAIITGTGQNIGVEYSHNENILNYSPSQSEVQGLLNNLRTYLHNSNIGPRVRMVTLIRSVRDGYLSQQSVLKLEHAVLDILHDILPDAQVVPDGRRTWGAPAWLNIL